MRFLLRIVRADFDTSYKLQLQRLKQDIEAGQEGAADRFGLFIEKILTEDGIQVTLEPVDQEEHDHQEEADIPTEELCQSEAPLKRVSLKCYRLKGHEGDCERIPFYEPEEPTG